MDIKPAILQIQINDYRDRNLQGDNKICVGVTIKKRIISDKELTEDIQLNKENDLLKNWREYQAERHQNDLDSAKDARKQVLFFMQLD